MRATCGLEGWIAFGTLLGAAREGKVIGHDSDIDLAYLSEQADPGRDGRRAVRRRPRAASRTASQVQHKSGSFITVVFRVARRRRREHRHLHLLLRRRPALRDRDGPRARCRATAILPLRELEFEGRLLPAPADPDRDARGRPTGRAGGCPTRRSGTSPAGDHRPVRRLVRLADDATGATGSATSTSRQGDASMRPVRVRRLGRATGSSRHARVRRGRLRQRRRRARLAARGYEVLGLDYAAPGQRALARRGEATGADERRLPA